ncbi:hypothetical protein B0H12DRAFT_296620 [Mycena haematopus]|nr:hypothetical protein B0H12DRAFT_296620 [Mycena haematopus]
MAPKQRQDSPAVSKIDARAPLQRSIPALQLSLLALGLLLCVTPCSTLICHASSRRCSGTVLIKDWEPAAFDAFDFTDDPADRAERTHYKPPGSPYSFLLTSKTLASDTDRLG